MGSGEDPCYPKFEAQRKRSVLYKIQLFLAWAVCLMVSVVLFAGAVIFRGRAVAAEFRRRFHV